MNREALKELGLTDDQINTIMAAHGTAINTTKEELRTVTGERDSLQGQVAERDNQLSQLGEKVKGDEALTAEIDRLKSENADAVTKYQEKLEKQALSFATERVLGDYKVRNSKSVMALVDKESLALEGEEVVGLKEQLDALKESDAYLFESDEEEGTKKPRTVPSGNPNGGHNLPEQLTEHDKRMKKWR